MMQKGREGAAFTRRRAPGALWPILHLTLHRRMSPGTPAVSRGGGGGGSKGRGVVRVRGQMEGIDTTNSLQLAKGNGQGTVPRGGGGEREGERERRARGSEEVGGEGAERIKLEAEEPHVSHAADDGVQRGVQTVRSINLGSLLGSSGDRRKMWAATEASVSSGGGAGEGMRGVGDGVDFWKGKGGYSRRRHGPSPLRRQSGLPDGGGQARPPGTG